MKMSELDMYRQTAERLTDVVRQPSFAQTAKAGGAPDYLDKLTADVAAITREVCAKVADIHLVKGPIENEYQRGYDAAAREIAARIRSL